ncbi:MAG: phospho-sugar mutase [Deltaproteobacteria bacterium]|nr:phospho-sugar mutase [Deltaproteobacteria bacterium]
MAELIARARAYAERDVDPEAKAELLAIVGRAEQEDAAALADLKERFSGPMTFGTAGLRGLLGPGESRMNRVATIRTAFGVAKHLQDVDAGARTRGIVVGRDGRRMSDVFARDVAEVCLAQGFRVFWIEGPAPTPLLAFAVKSMNATAGIMITASHNPPAYNGLKVYWDSGAQIVPPIDALISAEIGQAPSAHEIPRVAMNDPSVAAQLVGTDGLREEYLRAIATLAVVDDLEPGDFSVAYSAMHGVGAPLFFEAMRRRGFRRVLSVAEQEAPNGDFPTLPFPNPEEPGAMDKVLALARAEKCDLALVHDPDADRLGAAAFDAAIDDYRVLTGNEIGVLLADHLFRNDLGGERLVVSTIVSSRLLERMAAAHEVRYAETLTGFKWIADEAQRLQALHPVRFVLGYEEALGYSVGPIVHDKDGISAGLVLAEMAADEKRSALGSTLFDALRRIRRRFGYYVGRQRSVTLAGVDGRRAMDVAMDRLRAVSPVLFGADAGVISTWDVATGTRIGADGQRTEVKRLPADVLVFDLQDGGRVAVRPSGTEPKLKFYFEVVEIWPKGEDPKDTEARGAARLDRLEASMLHAAGLRDL